MADPAGQRRTVPPGVDDHLVAPLGQRGGQGGDVHVLPTGVHAAEGRRAGWRARRPSRFSSGQSPLLVARASSASQSARKRASPYRFSAAARAADPGRARGSGSCRKVRNGRVQPVGVRAEHARRGRHRFDRLGGGQRRPSACRVASPRSATGPGRSSASDAGRPAAGPARRACRPGWQVLVRQPRSRCPEVATKPRSACRRRRPGRSAAKPGTRSAPTVRPRRPGSLTTTAPRGSSPVYRAPGSMMPCSITVVGAHAVVPVQPVEVGHVHDRDVAAVGERVTLARRRWPRVCCAPGRPRAGRSGPAAGPAANQVELMRALQHDDVERAASRSCSGASSRDRGRPVPGAGPADAVGASVGQHRHHVVVPALDERGRPTSVHVPEQDPHRLLTSRRVGWAADSSRTAPTICSADTDVRHGWPSIWQAVHRVSRHGRVLIAQQLDRYAERRPAQRRHHRREQRHHRSAHRRGQVRRPGVGDHGDLGPVEHRRQLRQIRLPARSDGADRRGSATAATMRLVSGCSGGLR